MASSMTAEPAALSVAPAPLAVANDFEALLLAFACAIAGYLLKRRGLEDGDAKLFSLPGGPTVPILACATIVWLLTSITLEEWTKVGLTLAAASVVFVVARAAKSPMQAVHE